MTTRVSHRRQERRGAIVVLAAFVMILFVMMLAFAIDHGYLLQARTQLQRTADAAALAAVQDLLPDADGNQDLNAARATVRSYVATNLGDHTFQVPDADIEIGRFETSSIYTGVTLLNSGLFDAVRVTLRRDGVINPMERLFFGRALGVESAALSASATAVLQKPTLLVPGTEVMPFAMPESEWIDLFAGDQWSVLGNGQIQDENGDPVSGTWGTVDIGATSDPNLAAEQIQDGIRQQDLDALHAEDRIDTSSYIDAAQTIWLNANPGFPPGIESAVQNIHGQTRIVPLYSASDTTGGEVNFEVVRWTIVTVVESQFSGDANTTFVTLRKSGVYRGRVASNNDLTTLPVFQDKFTSPVLVE